MMMMMINKRSGCTMSCNNVGSGLETIRSTNNGQWIKAYWGYLSPCLSGMKLRAKLLPLLWLPNHRLAVPEGGSRGLEPIWDHSRNVSFWEWMKKNLFSREFCERKWRERGGRDVQKGRENACCRWVKNEGLWTSISLWTNGLMISKCSFHMQRLNIDVKSGFSYNAAFVAAYRGSQFEMNVSAWPFLIKYNQWHACSLALWFAGIKEERKCLTLHLMKWAPLICTMQKIHMSKVQIANQFFRTTVQPFPLQG